MKIDKLTPEQEAQIPVIRDEFLRLGLSAEPADFEAAEQAVKDAYVVAGLQPPKLFIRLASPREGAIAAAILKNTRLGEKVGAQVGDQVRAQVGAAFYSQHEAGFLSFYAYFAKACGLECAQKLEPLTRIAAHCGWVWFFAGAAIITDRPRILRRDDQNRLHCEDGPSATAKAATIIFSAVMASRSWSAPTTACAFFTRSCWNRSRSSSLRALRTRNRPSNRASTSSPTTLSTTPSSNKPAASRTDRHRGAQMLPALEANMSPSIYQHYPTETLERWMAACARANQHAEAETIRQIISTRAAREEAA